MIKMHFIKRMIEKTRERFLSTPTDDSRRTPLPPEYEAELLPIPRRELTSQEMGWVREILAASQDWKDVDPGQLYAVAKCSCGCRSIKLKTPKLIQNPRLAASRGLIGDITIVTKDENPLHNTIEVMLFHEHGNLSWLDILWYDFENPVPETWEEISHSVYARD